MIYKYIIKNFLKKLFYITISMFLLIAILNIFAVDQNQYDFNLLQIIQLVIFRAPIFIEEIFMFLVIVSAITSFQDMLIHNELTVIRISGFSIIKIVTSICASVLLVGLIFITLFSPIAVILNQKANNIEKQVAQQKSLQYINNVWLKENIENDNNRIFYIKAVDTNNYEMNGITIWDIRDGAKFFKRINAKTMSIAGKDIILKDVIINSKTDINKAYEELRLKTNLNNKIIHQYQKNNDKRPKEIIYKIPEIKASLEKVGASSKKINLYFHSLLSKPLLLVVACILAAIFGINHSNRNKRNIIYVILGILFGLIIHIVITIIYAFGSSGVLEVFIATWFIAMILFFFSSLLLIKKEI